MERLVSLKREEFEREFGQWREDWAHTLNRQSTSKRTIKHLTTTRPHPE